MLCVFLAVCYAQEPEETITPKTFVPAGSDQGGEFLVTVDFCLVGEAAAPSVMPPADADADVNGHISKPLDMAQVIAEMKRRLYPSQITPNDRRKT